MRYKSAVLVLGAAFLWSTSYTVARISLDHIPPSTLALIRFVASIAILLILYFSTQRSKLKPLVRSEKAALILCGLLGFTLYNVIQNWGLTMAYTSDASLIVGFYPVIVALFEWKFGTT